MEVLALHSGFTDSEFQQRVWEPPNLHFKPSTLILCGLAFGDHCPRRRKANITQVTPLAYSCCQPWRFIMFFHQHLSHLLCAKYGLLRWLSAKESTCQCRKLGWEDPLEKETATHFSILGWRIPWTEEPGGLQSMRSQKAGPDLVTEHKNTFYVPGTVGSKGSKYPLSHRVYGLARGNNDKQMQTSNMWSSEKIHDVKPRLSAREMCPFREGRQEGLFEGWDLYKALKEVRERIVGLGEHSSKREWRSLTCRGECKAFLCTCRIVLMVLRNRFQRDLKMEAWSALSWSWMAYLGGKLALNHYLTRNFVRWFTDTAKVPESEVISQMKIL